MHRTSRLWVFAIVLAIPAALHAQEKQRFATLMEALRYQLDLTGCKPVCTDGSSGAATVLVDGKPMQANTMLAMQASASV